MRKKEKGEFYETKAAEYLKICGYRIIAKNFRTRQGEIDIIARDRDCIAFVEVRARKAGALVTAQESLDRHKQRRIEAAARMYCQRDPEQDYRFDVVAIEENGDFRRYELIKGAFYAGEKR